MDASCNPGVIEIDIVLRAHDAFIAVRESGIVLCIQAIDRMQSQCIALRGNMNILCVRTIDGCSLQPSCAWIRHCEMRSDDRIDAG